MEEETITEDGKFDFKKVTQCKEDHSIPRDLIHALMIDDWDLFEEIIKLFKFLLLIPPSTANVERGFSVLTLLVTKLPSSISPQNINQLMCLVISGPDQMLDEIWKLLIDNFRDSGILS